MTHTLTASPAQLIQFPTHASMYDGPFGGDAGWPAAGMGYVIFSLQGSQKTVMITGDACPVSLRKCVERCGSKLKSDILQMPHHGLCDTGYEAFYRAVAADTLLIPISRAGDLAMHSDIYKEAALINQAAELAAGTRYPAYQGIVSMTI